MGMTKGTPLCSEYADAWHAAQLSRRQIALDAVIREIAKPTEFSDVGSLHCDVIKLRKAIFCEFRKRMEGES